MSVVGLQRRAAAAAAADIRATWRKWVSLVVVVAAAAWYRCIATGAWCCECTFRFSLCKFTHLYTFLSPTLLSQPLLSRARPWSHLLDLWSRSRGFISHFFYPFPFVSSPVAQIRIVRASQRDRMYVQPKKGACVLLAGVSSYKRLGAGSNGRKNQHREREREKLHVYCLACRFRG